MIAIPLAQAGGANADEILSLFFEALCLPIAVCATIGITVALVILRRGAKKEGVAMGCLYYVGGAFIGAIIGAIIGFVGLLGFALLSSHTSFP